MRDPAPAPETRPYVLRRTLRIRDREAAECDDGVVVEEPLEVRLDGAPVAVVMRTPGDDFELAVGFLLAEGLVDGPEEIAGVSWCRVAGQAGPTNRVSVATREGSGAQRVEGRRRVVVAASACGLCGRTTLDEIHRAAPRPVVALRPRAEALQAALRALRRRQVLFERTGAVHGAAVVGPDGEVAAAYEDVGRHNAVDKCVGRLALEGRLPLTGHLLAVSGRVSFEIVQKAVMAGLPAICGVGAASSLAVDLARQTEVFLAGFVRGGGCNVYAGRLTSARPRPPDPPPAGPLRG